MLYRRTLPKAGRAAVSPQWSEKSMNPRLPPSTASPPSSSSSPSPSSSAATMALSLDQPQQPLQHQGYPSTLLTSAAQAIGPQTQSTSRLPLETSHSVHSGLSRHHNGSSSADGDSSSHQYGMDKEEDDDDDDDEFDDEETLRMVDDDETTTATTATTATTTTSSAKTKFFVINPGNVAGSISSAQSISSKNSNDNIVEIKAESSNARRSPIATRQRAQDTAVSSLNAAQQQQGTASTKIRVISPEAYQHVQNMLQLQQPKGGPPQAKPTTTNTSPAPAKTTTTKKSTKKGTRAKDKQKNQKVLPERRRSAIQRWTPEEDVLLVDAIQKYGQKRWQAIAAHVRTKTDKQCHQHWFRVLHPSLDKSPWTQNEDGRLREAVTRHGESSWKQVSTSMGGSRSDTQCRDRWFSLNNIAHIKKSRRYRNDSDSSSAPQSATTPTTTLQTPTADAMAGPQAKLNLQANLLTIDASNPKFSTRKYTKRRSKSAKTESSSDDGTNNRSKSNRVSSSRGVKRTAAAAMSSDNDDNEEIAEVENDDPRGRDFLNLLVLATANDSNGVSTPNTTAVTPVDSPAADASAATPTDSPATPTTIITATTTTTTAAAAAAAVSTSSAPPSPKVANNISVSTPQSTATTANATNSGRPKRNAKRRRFFSDEQDDGDYEDGNG